MGWKKAPLLYLAASSSFLLICFHTTSRKGSMPYEIIENNILYDEYNCNCPRNGPALFPDSNRSICSDWASSRGEGQNVVSYTVFGDITNSIIFKKYYNQIEDRLKDVKQLYKGLYF